jgi:signal transduction histidine kinase
LITIVAVAVAYFGAAKFGLSLAVTTRQVSAVWPPTGIALVALLLLGVRIWPGIYLAALLINLDAAESLGTAAGIAVGNTLIAVVALLLLRKVFGFDTALERVRDAVGLVVVAALSACVSASCGVANLALHGLVPWSAFGSTWSVWWVGDTMGILLVTPVLLTWVHRPIPRFQARRAIEGAAAFLTLAVVSVVVLWGEWGGLAVGSQLKYAVFPFIMWIALRFGPRANASAVLVVSVVAIWGVVNDRDPLSAGLSSDQRLVLLDMLLAVVALTGLALSAVVAERAHARAAFQSLYDQQRDIAEAATAELQQAQRLESVGQLAGGVAHDFNNLLAGIMNYAALVADGLEKQTKRLDLTGDTAFTALTQDVGEITKVAARAARLTHQLLIFSRREVAKPEVLDLNSIVIEIENLLHMTIGENIDLGLGLSSELPLIKADPGQIEQVLMNLAVNARDAMPDGGKLWVETAAFQADDAYSRLHGISLGMYAGLSVTDTGSGMSNEVAGRAFEPFFSTKSKTEGSGLGLATVYGIATQAGGDVAIYSEQGVGTTIRVSFPATQCDTDKGLPVPQDRNLSAHGETILLVEDEDMVRAPTRRILDQHGYTVLEASNADDALRVVQEHPGELTLLLTDVIMPGRSGKALAAEILRLSPETNILYMSAYSADVIVDDGLPGAEVHLIEKPFPALGLLRMIRDILDDAESECVSR